LAKPRRRRLGGTLWYAYRPIVVRQEGYLEEVGKKRVPPRKTVGWYAYYAYRALAPHSIGVARAVRGGPRTYPWLSQFSLSRFCNLRGPAPRNSWQVRGPNGYRGWARGEPCAPQPCSNTAAMGASAACSFAVHPLKRTAITVRLPEDLGPEALIAWSPISGGRKGATFVRAGAGAQHGTPTEGGQSDDR
jgi:hypothetical protein